MATLDPMRDRGGVDAEQPLVPLLRQWLGDGAELAARHAGLARAELGEWGRAVAPPLLALLVFAPFACAGALALTAAAVISLWSLVPGPAALLAVGAMAACPALLSAAWLALVLRRLPSPGSASWSELQGTLRAAGVRTGGREAP